MTNQVKDYKDRALDLSTDESAISAIVWINKTNKIMEAIVLLVAMCPLAQIVINTTQVFCFMLLNCSVGPSIFGCLQSFSKQMILAKLSSVSHVFTGSHDVLSLSASLNDIKQLLVTYTSMSRIPSSVILRQRSPADVAVQVSKSRADVRKLVIYGIVTPSDCGLLTSLSEDGHIPCGLHLDEGLYLSKGDVLKNITSTAISRIITGIMNQIGIRESVRRSVNTSSSLLGLIERASSKVSSSIETALSIDPPPTPSDIYADAFTSLDPVVESELDSAQRLELSNAQREATARALISSSNRRRNVDH